MRLKIQFGSFKGKFLEYVQVKDIRPSLARARDVLFNWLYRLDNQRCLDLFSGSGILGVEALSLGASFVEYVDIIPKNTQQLTKHLEKLSLLDRSLVKCQDAFAWLEKDHIPFDLILLDPPFAKGFLNKVLEHEKFIKLLAPGAQVYLEAEKGWTPGKSWTINKHKHLGDVSIYLVSQAKE